MNDRVITPRDKEWPQPLNEIGCLEPIEKLYVRGLPLTVGDRTVAIVGARRPTAAGVEAARGFARALAEAGFEIVSGLAVGIDAVAHKAALDAGGYTVAVLGCGLDVEYPKRNLALKSDIAKRGTIVTEYPVGTPPHPGNFPNRNRIVAALSRAVVFVEGGLKSGGRITVSHALDADRYVFAVPGSIRNPMAAGPNEIIRTSNGALVTEVRHVFQELEPSLVWDGPPLTGLDRTPPTLEPGEEEVIGYLDDTPNQVDSICSALDMAAGEVALALARLEIRGFAVRLAGGYAISEGGARARKLLSADRPGPEQPADSAIVGGAGK